MVDYIKFLAPFNYAELATLIIAIYQYKQEKTWLLPVIFFVAVSVISELGLSYYFAIKYHNNDKLYSLYSFFCPAFYLYLYNQYFKSQSWSTVLKYTTMAWAASCVLILWLSDKAMEEFPYYSGMVFTALVIFIYFYQALFIDQYRDLMREGLFYFSVGLILFFFTSFAIFIYFDKLTETGMPRFYFQLVQFGNLFLWAGCLGLVLCPKMW